MDTCCRDAQFHALTRRLPDKEEGKSLGEDQDGHEQPKENRKVVRVTAAIGLEWIEHDPLPVPYKRINRLPHNKDENSDNNQNNDWTYGLVPGHGAAFAESHDTIEAPVLGDEGTEGEDMATEEEPNAEGASPVETQGREGASQTIFVKTEGQDGA